MQRQQRNDDRLDETGNNRAELDEALTQHAARDHRQAQAHHEGQEQRRHHLQRRGHFDREVGLQGAARLGHIGQLGGSKETREQGRAHQVGQEA